MLSIKLLTFSVNVSFPMLRHNEDHDCDEFYDCCTEVNANDEQMDFQIVYASGMNGIAGLSPDKIEPNLLPLFDG
jgi:predicted membrane GTPase involved in stress response